MDDLLVHTIQNNHPTKLDVLLKTFVQIILAGCCCVVSAAFKYVPQPTATTFAFSSVFILFICLGSSTTILFDEGAVKLSAQLQPW